MLRVWAPFLPILVAGALAGCGGDDDGGSGGDLDRDALEQDISQRLAQATNSPAPTVDCPSDLPAKTGATIRCRVDVGGTQYGVTVTVTGTQGGSAQYDVQVDQ
jgi:hypothetical protein